MLVRYRAQAAAGATPRLLRYASTMVMEWLLLGSVIAGVYSRRTFLLKVFANPSRSVARSLALGFMVYLLGFMTIAITGSLLYFTPLFHKGNEAVVLAMSPTTPIEFVAWFFVSFTAGVCEEIIFRGYLLDQLTAWTKRPALAIVAAGALFGCVHLYEGATAMVALGALGIVYGVVARHCKGDLRAVIVAHTLQDFMVALLVLARPWALHHQPHP